MSAVPSPRTQVPVCRRESSLRQTVRVFARRTDPSPVTFFVSIVVVLVLSLLLKICSGFSQYCPTKLALKTSGTDPRRQKSSVDAGSIFTGSVLGVPTPGRPVGVPSLKPRRRYCVSCTFSPSQKSRMSRTLQSLILLSPTVDLHIERLTPHPSELIPVSFTDLPGKFPSSFFHRSGQTTYPLHSDLRVETGD